MSHSHSTHAIGIPDRVIRTLKCEWLRRVPAIKGLNHLGQLPADFACYYNAWRPHSTLEGAIPGLIHAAQMGLLGTTPGKR